MPYLQGGPHKMGHKRAHGVGWVAAPNGTQTGTWGGLGVGECAYGVWSPNPGGVGMEEGQSSLSLFLSLSLPLITHSPVAAPRLLWVQASSSSTHPSSSSSPAERPRQAERPITAARLLKHTRLRLELPGGWIRRPSSFSASHPIHRAVRFRQTVQRSIAAPLLLRIKASSSPPSSPSSSKPVLRTGGLGKAVQAVRPITLPWLLLYPWGCPSQPLLLLLHPWVCSSQPLLLLLL